MHTCLERKLKLNNYVYLLPTFLPRELGSQILAEL
jgi:hypothetical protein